MCGAAIEAVACRCRSCGEPFWRILRRSRLQRAVEVTLPEGIFHVEYIGSGIGYESVRVRPGATVRKTSFRWFVPRFDFEVGGRRAVVGVRVALWLAVCSFALRIDDVVIYEE